MNIEPLLLALTLQEGCDGYLGKVPRQWLNAGFNAQCVEFQVRA